MERSAENPFIVSFAETFFVCWSVARPGAIYIRTVVVAEKRWNWRVQTVYRLCGCLGDIESTSLDRLVLRWASVSTRTKLPNNSPTPSPFALVIVLIKRQITAIYFSLIFFNPQNQHSSKKPNANHVITLLCARLCASVRKSKFPPIRNGSKCFWTKPRNWHETQ